MRNGVPVVISKQQPEALTALCRAAEKCGAEPVVAGDDFTYLSDDERMDYRGLDCSLDNLRPALAGAHQQANMAVALAASEILRRQGVTLQDANLADGIASVFWPGRLEWSGSDPKVLLDGAHNGDSARALAEYLADSGYCRVHWLVGMKKDKSILDIMQPLLGLAVTLYCVEPPIEEALPVSELVRIASEAGVLSIVSCASVEEGVTAARNACSADEIVLAAGSLFLVAAVRELLEREKPTFAF